MRATDLASALTALLPTKRPVFLWGPPGVGKSSIVRQCAETLALSVCDVRAVLLDPVDLRGIPAVNGDHRAHWCQPDFLPSVVLSNPSGTTVPSDPAVLYALAGALTERARTASDGQINAPGTFAGRLPAEYGTLLVRDTIAVNPRACSQPAFAAWVRVHADLFARN